jgi:Uma2 family endonuclease
MATTIATPQKMLSAEEYLKLPDDGQRRELRRGRLVLMNPPGFRHGEVCSNVHFHVDSFVRRQQVGRTLTNDSGIITERDPDTVRGADVAYYSFQRVPQGHSPVGYAGVAPEIVFEVVSPTNTRTDILVKAGEYLRAGVNVVGVVDPQYQTVNLYYPDRPTKVLSGDEVLTFDDLPGFGLPVKVLFE